MSHQIPQYLNYVASIDISSAGSGYDSSSPPTITISGGGGTGAAATVSVLNGSLYEVEVINPGQDYTSSPTITLTNIGSGTGGTFVVNLGWGISPPIDHIEKSSSDIKYSLPEFIQTDYTTFVSFIEKYFEYMDEDGNPVNLLLNAQYSDIDDLNDAELNKRATELAVDFPQLLQADRKTLLKKIKNIFESKGTERSIKAYFKLLYNEEVDVYYPSKNILRASDGIWIEETSGRAVVGYEEYEVLQLNGRVADIRYHETIGSSNFIRTIPVTIPRVEKIVPTYPQMYEVFFKLPSGTTNIPGPGAQATATATVTDNVITGFTVTNSGYGYIAAPIIEISDSDAAPGTGASARAVVSGGKITSIAVISGGSGYNSATTSVAFNTDSIKTVLVEKGATAIEANVRAYLERTLTSLTASSFAGDAGFTVGDAFTITEPDNNNSSSKATIRVSSVDEYNVPTAWKIINAGGGYLTEQFSVSITSATAQTLTINAVTGYYYKYTGKYKDDRGKLSDVNRIQDNFKYQSYSYIVKSSLSQATWIKRYKDLIHPAGMAVFGDLIINHNINFAPFIGIQTNGLSIYEFKVEDIIISNDDTIDIVVQWVRVFADETDDGNEDNTATSTDALSLSVEPNFTDTIASSDDYSQDYVADDYLPLNYTGAGIGKYVEKGLSDPATASEVFTKALHYYREYYDNSTVTESIVLAIHRYKDYNDSATSTESLVLSFNNTLSDTASMEDGFAQEYVDSGYLPLNYTGSGISFYTQKLFAETPNASDVILPEVYYSRSFSDTGAVSNVFQSIISKPFTDTASSSDNFTHLIYLPLDLSDAITLNDSVNNIVISKQIGDIITTTSIPSINIATDITEAQSVTDTPVLTLQKPFNDSGSVADEGLATIQDYSDSSYFSEDFVGQGYNFS